VNNVSISKKKIKKCKPAVLKDQMWNTQKYTCL